jgi:membrane fusion protein (multidrug efflux system)
MSNSGGTLTSIKKHWVVFFFVVLGVLIVCAILSLPFFEEVRTNDAQVEGHIHPVNTRIAGTVVWVDPNVDDTHFVQAGAVIARLDRNDYSPTVSRLTGEEEASTAQLATARLNVPIARAAAQTRLSSARAAVAEAEADLLNAQSQRVSASALVTQVSASYKRAEDDRRRYEALVQTHEISKSEYDQRATEAKTLAAQLDAAIANVEAAEQRIAASRQKLLERKSDLENAETAPELIATAKTNVERAAADLKKSQATLLNATLDLGYTDITAPVSGIVGRKQIESGQRVTVGQLLLTLVPPKDVWAIANFKETQLHHMRVGQSATVHVDSYDRDLSGTVESIGGATGSRYSLIAPENATGNYVKVVQRVPVRIRLDSSQLNDQQPLLPGMSIEVTVHLKK